MNATEQARFRLRLAEGFLQEALQKAGTTAFSTPRSLSRAVATKLTLSRHNERYTKNSRAR